MLKGEMIIEGRKIEWKILEESMNDLMFMLKKKRKEENFGKGKVVY